MEMPDLVQLQKRQAHDVVILTVCLDGRPEDLDNDHEAGDHAEPATTAQDRAEIRRQVTRLVKSRGINYQILLDPAGEIGARFNGQELPTNVILDASGQVRRRFIGARDGTVLETMLREATDPASFSR